ncbi:TetR/AcrR family transcriptional regulator [Geothrix sp. PMB-07]|uniref:TetR/AcrR family transcriptional regulator n=1 Tax=Geothrix sp. PMB-07 TaxID=3068640 RepID=UPI00274159B7|nr:TetR/AcrR family transcriptional regulator [Geothrix sp. PMB-07]WLT30281.1 TetR/AcrR family transcriptional regulator [Geothrix sp. PMB-07]
MSTVPDHGLKEMVPVFGPEALGVGAHGSFHAALERLSAQGDLKARLLLSALSHFAAKGYDGVQVKEVAEEAGVSKPTLYYHFGSKEGLFRQLCLVSLSSMAARIQAMVAPLLAEPVKGREAVEAACLQLSRSYLGLLLESQEFTGFILRSIAVPSPDSNFRDLMPLVERGLSPLGLFMNHVFGTSLDMARKEVLLFTSLVGSLIEEKLRDPNYQITDAEIAWATRRWLHGALG